MSGRRWWTESTGGIDIAGDWSPLASRDSDIWACVSAGGPAPAAGACGSRASAGGWREASRIPSWGRAHPDEGKPAPLPIIHTPPMALDTGDGNGRASSEALRLSGSGQSQGSLLGAGPSASRDGRSAGPYTHNGTPPFSVAHDDGGLGSTPHWLAQPKLGCR
jgi:hypothetical protein